LYHIAACTTVGQKTEAQKRRENLVDIAIGLGLPILQMILRKSSIVLALDVALTISEQNTPFKAIVLTSSKKWAASRRSTTLWSSSPFQRHGQS
jgi:hypothetical protein